MRRRLLTPALLALAAACSAGEPSSADGPPAVTREAFEDVYVALRLAHLEAADTVERFETRRAEILETHGVTPEVLDAFLERQEVAELAAIWAAIEERLKEEAAARQEKEREAKDRARQDEAAAADSVAPPQDTTPRPTRQDGESRTR